MIRSKIRVGVRILVGRASERASVRVGNKTIEGSSNTIEGNNNSNMAYDKQFRMKNATVGVSWRCLKVLGWSLLEMLVSACVKA